MEKIENTPNKRIYWLITDFTILFLFLLLFVFIELFSKPLATSFLDLLVLPIVFVSLSRPRLYAQIYTNLTFILAIIVLELFNLVGLFDNWVFSRLIMFLVLNGLTYIITYQAEREKLIKEKDRQLKISNETLISTVNQLEIILGAINVGIYCLNPSGELIYVNKKGANDLGYYSPGKMKKQIQLTSEKDVFSVLDVFDPAFYDNTEHKFMFSVKDELDLTFLNLISTKKLKPKSHISKKIFPLFNSLQELEMVLIITHDISELVEKENQLKSELRLNLVVSKSIDLFLESKSKKELLQNYCKMLIENANYVSAWVGRVDLIKGIKKVHPISEYGFEDGYLDNINLTWEDPEFGNESTIEAIRIGQYSLIKDIQNDTKSKQWRDNAIKRGYQSSLALPFNYKENDNRISCSLNIYSPLKDGFSKQDIKTLSNIVLLLSVGLNTISNVKFDTTYEKLAYYFDDIPIPLIKDDLSKAIDYVHEKRKEGIVNFREYFTNHPDELRECFAPIKVIDINQAYINFVKQMGKLKTKDEIISYLEKSYYTKNEARNALLEGLLAILEGKKMFIRKLTTKSQNGKETQVILKVFVDTQIRNKVVLIFAMI